MKIIFLTLTIYLSSASIIFSQSNKAIDILNNYIRIIGGNNLNEIKTIHLIQERVFQGRKSILDTKIIKNKSLLLKSTFDEKEQRAIVKDGMGVNITSEGIFSMSSEQVDRYYNQIQLIPELEFVTEKYIL
ncbi:MAG: hypothetical protein AAGI07_18355, partial [Bacteroidota bacterium]